jgi:glycosyltransferase involved in cell wall biosynthesis
VSALIPLLYALHSGNLYGTERMALFTAAALQNEFAPVILAPPGPVHAEAQRMGMRAIPFRSAQEFGLLLRPLLAESKRLAFLATGVAHSAACLGWNLLYRRRLAHLHLVHGGANERLSYGRKRYLNGKRTTFIAVSAYVKNRLAANGVPERQVEVIENFLPASTLASVPTRPPFRSGGIRRIAVISRLDPEKRVDLLTEVLERNPDLHNLQIHVYGNGWDKEKLRARVAQSCLPIYFEGYRSDVPQQLAEADLLLHLCPVEPFGLAILEAIAARVPVLVPDQGGAGSLVRNGSEGFHFQANSAESLAHILRTVQSVPAETLNRITGSASALLRSRFSEPQRVADYRRILLEQLQ